MAAAKFYQSVIASEHLKLLHFYKWKKIALAMCLAKVSAPWEERKCKVSCLSGVAFIFITVRELQNTVLWTWLEGPWAFGKMECLLEGLNCHGEQRTELPHDMKRDLNEAMVFLFSSSLLETCSLQSSPIVNYSVCTEFLIYSPLGGLEKENLPCYYH